MSHRRRVVVAPLTAGIALVLSLPAAAQILPTTTTTTVAPTTTTTAPPETTTTVAPTTTEAPPTTAAPTTAPPATAAPTAPAETTTSSIFQPPAGDPNATTSTLPPPADAEDEPGPPVLPKLVFLSIAGFVVAVAIAVTNFIRTRPNRPPRPAVFEVADEEDDDPRGEPAGRTLRS